MTTEPQVRSQRYISHRSALPSIELGDSYGA